MSIDGAIILGSMEDFPDAKDFARHIGARLFGHLVAKCQGTLTHYHSDLYHDAIDLHRYLMENSTLEAPLHWLFSYSDTGTNLYPTDADYQAFREHNCTVTLWKEKHTYGDVVMARVKEV